MLSIEFKPQKNKNMEFECEVIIITHIQHYMPCTILSTLYINSFFFLTVPLEIDTIILVLQIKKLRPDMLTCPRIHSGAKIQTWEVMF